MSYIPIISGIFDGEPKPHIYQKKALGASEFDSVHGGCQFFKGNLQMSIGCTKNQPLIMIWGYTIQYYWGWLAASFSGIERFEAQGLIHGKIWEKLDPQKTFVVSWNDS